MGVSVTPPPISNERGSPGGRRLLLVLRLVRYRFFLFAGLLPYLLGRRVGVRYLGCVRCLAFWSGLGGVALSVIGVEAFNEFFDSKMGTDRVFDPKDLLADVRCGVLARGRAASRARLAVGIYLPLRGGWPVPIFAALGGQPPSSMSPRRSAGPTAVWARLVIALSYGPG